MVHDLGAPITAQFKGCITDIHVRNNQICFTETLHIGGGNCQVCHTIPIESIVVTEAPLALQAAWLTAGVATLLVPQVEQEAGVWGHHSFKYCGLTQIHRIEVVASPWTESQSTDADARTIERQEQAHITSTDTERSPLNLLQQLMWKLSRRAVSPNVIRF